MPWAISRLTTSPEAPLFHQILDGLQQIVGFVLLDFHVGIARDAEQPGVDAVLPGNREPRYSAIRSSSRMMSLSRTLALKPSEA